MQVEVNDEQKVSIRTDVERCGKETERGFTDACVIFGRILPHRTKRPAMCDGDVVKLSIGGNYDAVWTIDVHGHVAGVDLLLDACARGSKTYEGNLVGSFGQDVNEIVFVGFGLRSQ